jgi:hypothetical protein
MMEVQDIYFSFTRLHLYIYWLCLHCHNHWTSLLLSLTADLPLFSRWCCLSSHSWCWLHPALVSSSWHIAGWFVCSFSSAWQVDSTILTCWPITYHWLLDSASQSPRPSCPSHRRSTISRLSLFLHQQ